MKILALFLRIVAFFFRLLPCKRRVAFISRQSSVLSLDFRYLLIELHHHIADDAMEICLCEPETKDKKAFVLGTLRQLYLACTSKVVVIDGYTPAVCIPPRRKGTTCIQLWHSLGAVKKFGYQSLDTPAGRTTRQARTARMHKNYDLIIAAGPGAVPAYSEAFAYPKEAFRALGLPRMDYLLDPKPTSPRRRRVAQIAQDNPALSNGKLNIVYAPTLRKGEGYENWIDEYLGSLAACCPEERANLFFAGHPLDKKAGANLARDYPSLHILEDVSTIDLLEFADCVITDYSAICFEAGLLRKPTCFYTPDIDAYAYSPGLNIDLAAGEAGFCSSTAQHVMAMALGDDPQATQYFQRFQEFCDAYFQGIEFGCTRRVALLIENALIQPVDQDS